MAKYKIGRDLYDLPEEKVKAEKADIGIALDGDADRCILVDEIGNLINGDKILAIIAKHLKENNCLYNNTAKINKANIKTHFKYNKFGFLVVNKEYIVKNIIIYITFIL